MDDSQDDQPVVAPEPDPGPAPLGRPRRRGVWRRLLRAAVVTSCLVVAMVAIAIVWTETPWFKDWLRRYIGRQATSVLDGELSIGRLEGNLFSGVELNDVVLAQRGERIVAIDRVKVSYSVLEIISRGIVLDELVLQHPVIVARQTAQGWNVAHLVRPRATKPGGTGPSITIGSLRLNDGQVMVYRLSPSSGAALKAGMGAGPAPTRLDDLDAQLRLVSAPGALTFDLAHVSFNMADPALRIGHLGGQIVRRGDTVALARLRVDLPTSNLNVDGTIRGIGTAAEADLTVASTGLAFRELGLFLPAIAPIPLQPAFNARLHGPLDRLETELHFRSSAGGADGRVLVDFAGGRRRFEGDLQLARVNPAPWAQAPAFAGLVTGRAQFDLNLADAAHDRPFRGTFHFVGPDARAAGYAGRDVDVRGRLNGAHLLIEQGRALAYGARVTVAGTIEPVPGAAPGAQYSLEGRATGVDLRRLPDSIPIPDLDTRLDLNYTVTGRGTDFSGKAMLSDSIVEGAQLAGGTVGHFELQNRKMRYGATGQVAGLDLPRLGVALDIKAMTDPRFAGAINGTFTVDASGRAAKELQLSADGHLTKTTLLGAELPEMDVRATIENGRLAADLTGAFRSLEPEFVSGVPGLAGVLSGRIDGRATIRDLTSDITLDGVGFDGRIDLEGSTLRGVELTSAHLKGGFSGRSGRLDEAKIAGPLGEITASGPLALDATGSSKLAYTVARGDLARISALFDQTLGGTVALEGAITGNGSALVATGTGHVEQAVAAETVKAATLDLKYTATLPDVDVGRMSIDADVSGRKLEVAGQGIDTLDGHVGYAQRAVTFDARAADRTRHVEAAGRVDLLEGRQHIVLSKLAATVDTLTWQLRPGVEAAIDHDGRLIQIAGLSLAHEAASVAVDGSLAVGSSGGSHLEVRVQGVQLAEVGRMLQRPAAEYAGVVSGTATIEGSRLAPEIAGRFDVTGGTFRELRFEQLSGDVHYDGRFLGTDVTLVQQPGTTLVAKGLVPMSLLQGHDASLGQDPIDLRITSSTIGLELASGLTTALADLAGTAKIDLHVTGTADNPLFEGGVALSGGAFTVVATGRHYSELASTLRFEPGRMVIDALRAVDEKRDAIEVTGELGLRRTAFGAVSLQVKARQFGVLHNDFGNADIDADLKITGDVTTPKVEGDLTFHTGRIEVDRVLDKLTGGAYATQPLDDVPIPGEGLRPDEPATVGTITTSSGRTRTVRVPSTSPDQSGAVAAPGQGSADAKEKRGFFDGATLNIRVKIPDNLVLRGRDIHTSSTSLGLGNMNVTVGGDFRIRKDPGTPVALVGTVNTVRGSYDFRGRRFDILRDGRIQFQGNYPIDPALDVTAQRVIQPSGVEARIRIQGTAREPSLSFSSDPPLDQADILALIVFNRPLNSLGSGEKTSLVDLAGSTAAGFVVSPITESIGRALNLDLFEVQATSEGGAGGMVTIGQQVGNRLYFKFRQQFGAQEVSEFVLEYQLSSFLRLQAAGADGDGVGRANRSLTRRVERAGLDLIFYFSY